MLVCIEGGGVWRCGTYCSGGAIDQYGDNLSLIKIIKLKAAKDKTWKIELIVINEFCFFMKSFKLKYFSTEVLNGLITSYFFKIFDEKIDFLFRILDYFLKQRLQ